METTKQIVDLEGVPPDHPKWVCVPWSNDFSQLLDSVIKGFKDTPNTVLLQTSAGKIIDSCNFLIFRGEKWHAYPDFGASREFFLHFCSKNVSAKSFELNFVRM